MSPERLDKVKANAARAEGEATKELNRLKQAMERDRQNILQAQDVIAASQRRIADAAAQISNAEGYVTAVKQVLNAIADEEAAEKVANALTEVEPD